MKRIIITLFVLLSMFSSFSEGVREDYAQNKVYKIGISKLLAHPALDAIEEGIKDYLDSTGYAFEYDVQNANGEVTAASQIAQVFKDEGTDLNIGIATPTAQALANVCVDTPLIYSSVTDPTAAGLVGKGMENIAGVSDMVPVAAHLSLIMQIVLTDRRYRIPYIVLAVGTTMFALGGNATFLLSVAGFTDLVSMDAVLAGTDWFLTPGWLGIAPISVIYYGGGVLQYIGTILVLAVYAKVRSCSGTSAVPAS